ncbi:glycogen synthase [Parasphaerochaeta coccoides]|uniref:Glycogen synthase n=1 Tax=Parasphaerochaeta coccoides (strain ATCC BAA-1237 / DSM 17374 / SPN1) TaxID=760011 RepID=F4GIM5_PARC1|nr:glycogen/starch synthase [Parasphaerochaeta coccoides]AEC02159.1 Glycogen synthase [Parasphaerochaeta coccoides DSM 17374]
MNVLMVSSESVPYAKSGGLADVVGSLSLALASGGVDVRVLLPLYDFMKEGFGEKDETRFSVNISFLGRLEVVGIRQAEHDGVIYYAIEHEWFSGRQGIYGASSFLPYPDNFQRFMLLDKTVFPLCLALDWRPDIIHCHDWTTGFIPYLLTLNDDPFFSDTRSIFSIHNLAYQGKFARLDLLGANIPPHDALFSGQGTEKTLNMMKAGIALADTVATVSPTYAKEIQTPAHGCGLDDLLATKGNELAGILNGIDENEWNPQTDKHFSSHFSIKNLSGKEKLKQELCAEAGLRYDPDVPLVAMITRLAEQKGLHELLDGSPCALEILLTGPGPLQFMVVGTGEACFEDKLKALDAMHPNLSVKISFSDSLAHRLEGAADFFLMPSRYEPCGLNQMYSLRYGTIPIARRTGGLADSIIDLTEHPGTGTGFLFDEMSPSGIVTAVQDACTWWSENAAIVVDARKRGMKTDFSWRSSAHAYMELYSTVKTGGI